MVACNRNWYFGPSAIRLFLAYFTRSAPQGFYPEPIRQWIARNGGLGIEMMYLSGPDLMGIYRQYR
jgi:hypothetical protein